MENFWNVIGLDGYSVIQLQDRPEVGDTLDLYEYHWGGGDCLYTVEHIDDDTKTLTLTVTEHSMT